MIEKAISDFNIEIENNREPVQNSTLPPTSLVASLWAKHVHTLGQNTSSIHDELHRFRCVNIATCEDDILQFWRANENTFPKLAKVARVLFGIPITSSASESAFSTAGSLIRKDRAAITPYRIEKNTFCS